MIRPASKHVLEAFAALVAVVTVGVAILGFRLAGGPVSLSFLTPTIASLIEEELDGFDAEVGDAALEWSREARALKLKVMAVNVRDGSGRSVATIPELELGLSTAGLRRGLIAPTRVRLMGVALVIERDESGQFSVGGPNGPGREGEGETRLSGDLLKELLGREGFDGTTGLAELDIQKADILLKDRRTGISIRAPNANLAFRRGAEGMTLAMEAAAFVADERFTIEVDGTFDAERAGGLLSVRFSPVRLSHVAPLSPFFAHFASVDFPVSGSSSVALGEGGIITRAELALEGHSGQFLPPWQPTKPMAIDTASLKATYLPRTGEIELEWLSFEGAGNAADVSGQMRVAYGETAPLRAERLSLDLTAKEIRVDQPEHFTAPFALDQVELLCDVSLGEAWAVDLKGLDIAFDRTRINLAGRIDAAPGSPAVRLDGVVADLDAAQLDVLWPVKLEVKARDWVTRHVHAGRLTRGVLTVDAPAGAFAAKEKADKLFVLDFHVDEGTATYVTGLPPLTGASADMRLTNKTFRLDLARGEIEGVKLEKGSVLIHALGKKGTPIDISAAGAGRVEDILAILDHPPLRLISKFGMKPEDVTGEARATFAMTFPQALQVPPEAILFSVSGQGEEVALPTLIEGKPIENGKVAITVNERGIEALGRADVAGVPLDIRWSERFHDNSPTSSTYGFAGVVDGEALARLGFDFGDRVGGRVGLDVEALGNGREIAGLEGRLDLTETSLDIGEIGWKKPAGKAVSATFSAALAGDQLDIKRLEAKGEGVDLQGALRFGSGRKIEAADLPRVHLEGFAKGSLEARRGQGDALSIDIAGNYLNAGPLLKSLMDRKGGGAAPAFALDANLATADLRGGVRVADLRVRIVSDREQLRTADVSGRFAPNTDFYAVLSETGENVRRLTVGSDDAGRLVKGLMGMESIVGGRLALNLRLAKDGERDSQNRLARAGTLRIEQFKVIDLPILARLLSVGSLEGVGDLLQGEGLAFRHLEAPFWLEGDLIGIEDGRAAGSSIGVTFQGVIDRRAEKLDLAGSIVPAYALNSVLGNVPVVGALLISREGEGVFGFTYALKGETDEPLTTVNPLAALAPGFLRRIFEIGDAQARGLPAQAEPPKAQ